jgi:hypothetical protein
MSTKKLFEIKNLMDIQIDLKMFFMQHAVASDSDHWRDRSASGVF